jgi:hypothetical protein
MDVATVNALLDRLESERFKNEDDAFASIALAADAINQAWADASTWTLEDRQERLHKWLSKLDHVARRAADQFEALSFSIAVSFPPGVSVSITAASPVSRPGFLPRRPLGRLRTRRSHSGVRRSGDNGPRVASASLEEDMSSSSGFFEVAWDVSANSRSRAATAAEAARLWLETR